MVHLRNFLSFSIRLILTLLFVVSIVDVVVGQTQAFNEISTFQSEQELLRAHPEFAKRTINKVNGRFTVSLSGANAKQQSIAGAPSRLNSFVFSPQDGFFTGFEETEGRSDKLFFFNAEGQLLSEYTVNIYPMVAYSADGQFVTAYNIFGGEFFVFRKNGQLLFSGDYVDLIKDNSEILYNVLISESASHLLINAGKESYLFETASKTKVFQAHTGIVLSGAFKSDKGKVILNISSDQASKVDLIVLSKANGEELGKVSHLSNVLFTKTGFVTVNNSIYQEYEVR